MFKSLNMWVGPVYSGKTSNLIKTYEDAKSQKEATPLYFKFTRTIRKGKLRPRQIKSHAENILVTDGYLVNTFDDVLTVLETYKHEPTHLFFDEIQFVSDWSKYVFIVEDKQVYMACIDMDHNGRPFEIVGTLMCTATDVTKCHSGCSVEGCYDKSEFSILKEGYEASGSVVEKDIFIPVCRQCFYRKTRENV